MRRTYKRMVSAVLALVLVLGLLPTTALAGIAIPGAGGSSSSSGETPWKGWTYSGWAVMLTDTGVTLNTKQTEAQRAGMASTLINTISNIPKHEAACDYGKMAFFVSPSAISCAGGTSANHVRETDTTWSSTTVNVYTRSESDNFSSVMNSVMNKALTTLKGNMSVSKKMKSDAPIDLIGGDAVSVVSALTAFSGNMVCGYGLPRNNTTIATLALKPTTRFDSYVSSLSGDDDFTLGQKQWVAYTVLCQAVAKVSNDNDALTKLKASVPAYFGAGGSVTPYFVDVVPVCPSSDTGYATMFSVLKYYFGCSLIQRGTSDHSALWYAIQSGKPGNLGTNRGTTCGAAWGSVGVVYNTTNESNMFGHYDYKGTNKAYPNSTCAGIEHSASAAANAISQLTLGAAKCTYNGKVVSDGVTSAHMSRGWNRLFGNYGIESFSSVVIPSTNGGEEAGAKARNVTCEEGVIVKTPSEVLNSESGTIDMECVWHISAQPKMGLKDDLSFGELGVDCNNINLLDALRLIVDAESMTNGDTLAEYTRVYAEASGMGCDMSGIPTPQEIKNSYYKYSNNKLGFKIYAGVGTQLSDLNEEESDILKTRLTGYFGRGDGANDPENESATLYPDFNYPRYYSQYKNPQGVGDLDKRARGSVFASEEVACMVRDSFVAELQSRGVVDISVVTDGCCAQMWFDSIDSIRTLYAALQENPVIECTTHTEMQVSGLQEGETRTAWAIIGGGWMVNGNHALPRISPNKASFSYTVEENSGYYRTESVFLGGDPEDERNYEVVVTDDFVEYPVATTVRSPEVSFISEGWTSFLCFNNYKLDYTGVGYTNPEWPNFHSTVDPYPHSEFNQGTVNAGATSPTRKFNSMTGTPTFTATERSELIDSVENTGYYGKDGHYYQYYAAGGTEFVVEFDGKFYKNQTATRQFTVEVQTSGACSESGPPCPGESAYHEHWTTVGDPPTPVLVFAGMTHDDGCCGAPLHTAPHAHYQHGIWTGSITYPGLSYVEIENVRVYKLSDARLDGTYALLEQDEVFATVQAMAPGLSMNIAGSNTAKAGRMVYDWIPDGNTGAGGSDPDHLYWGAKTCTSTCGEDGQDLEDYINQCLGPGHTGAWCLSDFIVLHTSAGTQSVLYHEYHSINDGPLLISCSGSSGGPRVGTSEASASVELYQDTEFEVKEYEEVWKSNPWTSEGAGWEEGGQLTYGGFNGQPMNLSTTYKSTVPGTTNINMSWGSWTGTQAYQNKSKVFGARGANSFLQKNEPSKTFRLMRDQLIIPDHKQNGDYDFTKSQVFYELIASKDSGDPKHLTVYSHEPQYDFNRKDGFTLIAGYSNDSPYTNTANSIVVYNPVSNQNAIVISLPDERDQRIDPPDVVQPGLGDGCPGASCEFSELDCTETTHLHNSSCYIVTTRISHSANNIHVHKWTTPEGVEMECPKTGGNMCAGQPCMATGTHRSAYCPYGHSCNGCSTCHVCQSNGGGGYYITHPSGCTYAGQTHYSTSYPYCTQCGHSCGGSYTLAEHYTCGNLPLNAHQCDSSKFVYLCDGAVNKHVHDGNCPMTAEKTTSYQNFYYRATGTDLFSFVAAADGTVEFCSTSYTADPRGRIYVNGVCVVDNDDGGNGLNFHAKASVRKGDRVVLNAYQYGSAGAGTISGWYKTPGGYNCGNTPNYHEHNSSCPKRPECFETTSVNFSCSNPHHTWDTDWHVYTTGRLHKDGSVCKGQGCTNMSDIQVRNGVYLSVSDLSHGTLVRHSDGQVHLTRQGTTRCDMCNKSFTFYANTTQTTRVLTEAEIEEECAHYPMGDARCWKPCGDPEKHSEVRDHIVDMNGNEIVQGDFINLDYGFTIYFPNNGDFYQTGKKSSLEISAERGWGYVNNMDTTEWIKSKYVVFSFDVVHKGISYPANTKIYLSVPDVYFDFYCPMENDERAGAEVMFGTVAINALNPVVVTEAKFNESTNKRIVPPYSRPHDADKRFNIDVVGRIGALTMNDVGDFRYSNFFKQTIDGWLVPNVIRRVDTSKQLNIVVDDTDIRGIDIDDALIHQGTSESKALNGYSTGSHVGDTYGIREERLRNIWEHPLVPSYLKSSADGAHGSEPGYYRDDGTFVPTPNNQSALCKQPVRIGYDAYMDFSTIGNYYGKHRTSNGDDVVVRPHYFRLRWDNANAYLTPADVYRLDDGVYTLVNDFDSDGGVPLTNKTQVSLNWVEECARRNYDAVEQRKTEFVHTNYGLDLPRGSQFVYGTYNLMSLWDRNRTSIGTRYTYGVDTDPSGGFEDWIGRYDLQGARWHFNLGLPSSSVFVASGERPTDENIKNFAGEDGQAVIVCALEIYARGDVWNLIYDGKDINSPFKITPDGPEFNPNTWNTPTFKYPGREEDLVIAEIISINHSSKEDVTTSGTH